MIMLCTTDWYSSDKPYLPLWCIVALKGIECIDAAEAACAATATTKRDLAINQLTTGLLFMVYRISVSTDKG